MCALGDPKVWVWMKPVPDFINACHAVQFKPRTHPLSIDSQLIVDQFFLIQFNIIAGVGRHWTIKGTFKN